MNRDINHKEMPHPCLILEKELFGLVQKTEPLLASKLSSMYSYISKFSTHVEIDVW